MVADDHMDMSTRSGQHPSLEEHARCDVRYAQLVELVEELRTPVTLDQVVDGVVERRLATDCPPASWHDLHEELYAVDLPALDAVDQVEFDIERGLVDSTNR